jgi:hypothetical protein
VIIGETVISRKSNSGGQGAVPYRVEVSSKKVRL